VSNLFTLEQLKDIDQRLAQRQMQLKQEIQSVATEIEADLERAAEREVGDAGAKYAVQEDISVDQAEINRDRAELSDIQAARQRIAEGTYGQCVNCDVAIQLARLAAHPAALRCTQCQAAFERSGR